MKLQIIIVQVVAISNKDILIIMEVIFKGILFQAKEEEPKMMIGNYRKEFCKSG